MTIETDHTMNVSAVVRLVEQARQGLEEEAQEPWLSRIDHAFGAIEHTVERACRDGDTGTALEISAALEQYWLLRSKLSAGCEWVRRALALDGGTAQQRADAQRVLGELEFARGHYEQSINAHEHALELYTELNDTERVVDTLCAIGFIAFIRGRLDWAVSVYVDARTRSRTGGFPVGEARALGELALIAQTQSDYEGAITLYEQAVTLLRVSGDTAALASMLDQQGMVAGNHGDIERAITCLEESVELFGALGRTSSQALASIFLGDAERKRGNHTGARACFERSAELAGGMGDAGGEGLALLHLGRLERDLGAAERTLSLVERSCDLLRVAEDSLWCATALLDLGRLHRTGHRVGAAQRCFEESLRLRRGLG